MQLEERLARLSVTELASLLAEALEAAGERGRPIASRADALLAAACPVPPSVVDSVLFDDNLLGLMLSTITWSPPVPEVTAEEVRAAYEAGAVLGCVCSAWRRWWRSVEPDVPHRLAYRMAPGAFALTLVPSKVCRRDSPARS